jgi:hypothetical protein
MGASAVRIDCEAERHPRLLRHTVERGPGADLVEADADGLGCVESAHDGVGRQLGKTPVLLLLYRKTLPAHEHMFAYRSDGVAGSEP